MVGLGFPAQLYDWRNEESFSVKAQQQQQQTNLCLSHKNWWELNKRMKKNVCVDNPKISV